MPCPPTTTAQPGEDAAESQPVPAAQGAEAQSEAPLEERSAQPSMPAVADQGSKAASASLPAEPGAGDQSLTAPTEPAPTAGAALVLVAVTLASVAQYFFLRRDESAVWMLSAGLYLIAIAATLLLLDLRTTSARLPLWRQLYGLPPLMLAFELRRRAAGLGARPAVRSVRASFSRVRHLAASAPMRFAFALIAFALSAVVVVVLHVRGDADVSYWDMFTLWVLSICLYLLALCGPDILSARARLLAVWRGNRQLLTDVALIWLGALALRLPGLDRGPDVISGDEGIVGNIARSFGNGRGNMFTVAWAYSLILYLVHAPFVLALDGGLTALRLPDAIGGSFSAPLTYLIGRRYFGRRVGLLAGVAMASFHMHVHLSRIALGHALDGTVAAFVIYMFLRGLEQRDHRWMALSGIGLGLAQYGYVGGRLIDLVLAAYVVLIIVFRPASARRIWGPIAAALGAALLTAAPMIRYAVDRPGDYLTRVNAEGLLQSGGFAWRVQEEGSAAWRIIADQVAGAVLALVKSPVALVYDAQIPLFGGVTAVLFVLGLAMALWRWRDVRFLLLALHVVGGFVMLVLGQNVSIAAYRMAGVLPSALLLAAVALNTLAEGALRGLRLPILTPALAAGLVVVYVSAQDVRYYFGEHIPACRYVDAGTATASVAAQYVGEHAEQSTVFALTEPEVRLEVYPSTEYLAQRTVRPWPSWDPELADPGQPGSDRFIYSLPDDIIGLGDLVGRARPAMVVAVPERASELTRLSAAFPRSRRHTITRCGDATLEILEVPGAAGD